MEKETLELVKNALNKRIEKYEQRNQLDISTAYQVALELLLYAENDDIESLKRFEC